MCTFDTIRKVLTLLFLDYETPIPGLRISIIIITITITIIIVMTIIIIIVIILLLTSTGLSTSHWVIMICLQMQRMR